MPLISRDSPAIQTTLLCLCIAGVAGSKNGGSEGLHRAVYLLGPGNKRRISSLVSTTRHILVSVSEYVLSIRIPLLDGKTTEQAKENLRARYLATMKANYMLWPAAQVML